MEICIQAIQDTLIEQYSKLGTVLENEVGKKNSERNKLSKIPGEAIDTILNAERAEKTAQVTRNSIPNESAIIQEDVSGMPHEFDPNDSANNNKNGFTGEHYSPMLSHEVFWNCFPS